MVSTTVPQIFRFPHCSVMLHPWGSEVLFPGLAPLVGTPQDTIEYKKQARDIGYGDNTLRMCREHDLIHCFLAALEDQPSPTLLAIARGGRHYPGWREEEAMVLGLQSYINKWRG